MKLKQNVSFFFLTMDSKVLFVTSSDALNTDPDVALGQLILIAVVGNYINTVKTYVNTLSNLYCD